MMSDERGNIIGHASGCRECDKVTAYWREAETEETEKTEAGA